MTAVEKLPQEAASYLTFHLGSTFYALPVANVRYIVARNTIKVRETPTSEGKNYQLFDFEGQAVPLYRFCDIAGCHSQVDEAAGLGELLSLRQQDHINWVDALEHSIRTGEAFTKATDPHQCAFGQWYDHYHPEDEELAEIMRAFDAPHKRIHSLGLTLTDMAHKQGKVSEAIEILNKEKSSTLRQLLAQFGKASSRLEDMVKPVVLVLGVDQRLFALEVETLADIKPFGRADWLSDESDFQSFFQGYFQGEHGQVFLNISVSLLLAYAESFGESVDEKEG